MFCELYILFKEPPLNLSVQPEDIPQFVLLYLPSSCAVLSIAKCTDYITISFTIVSFLVLNNITVKC